MVTTEDVRAAYRLILGREPENEGVLVTHAKQLGSLEDLRKAFLYSPEFQKVRGDRVPRRSPENWPRMEIEVDTSKAKLSSMMRHVEKNWHHLGLSEPHWSVITSDVFRSANISKTEDLFYESGKNDVERLQRAAERCGICLADFTRCFELGCGVGRVTVWLAKLFERIVAADISPSHLAIAAQTMERFDRGNVDLVNLKSFGTLEAMPEFDIFYSVLVLQHNPPPMIAALLKAVLTKLRPGGVAYFQVPTYRLNYRFAIDEYLHSTSPTGGMEMHAIPQSILFDLLRQCGCRLLECREDNSTGDDHTISNTIFVAKSPAAA